MKKEYTEKYTAVREYLNGKSSMRQIAKKHGVSMASFQVWVRKYRSEGIEGLKPQHKRYSQETKRQAVEEYLKGAGSQETICEKYKISSKSHLQRWIMCYNSHNEFKSSRGAGGESYMTKGRKTTLEERIEIVSFCIEHGKDYPLTISTYGVSYQQIYSWLRKYEEKGVDGLSDGRGRTKPVEEMTEIEKLKAENKLLKAQLRDKEMENALIKKLRELEGWDQ